MARLRSGPFALPSSPAPRGSAVALFSKALRDARKALALATGFPEWLAIATAIDDLDGAADWRRDQESGDYDWRLLRGRLEQIRAYREAGDIARLARHLRQGLHWNLANLGNPALYTRALAGTKHLIHDYVDEVEQSLDVLLQTTHPALPQAEKARFFSQIALSYGRSCLMLSGGATLGLFHVGVVKALYRDNLLPQVISGSSAGSIVSAAVGTRTPADADTLMDPSNAVYDFWKLLSLRQMLRRGAVMDQSQLRRAIASNVPDMTFEEAFKTSQRIINITVSPAGSNQPPRLLNHLTFPYVYVREAVLASCAVPMLFPPVTLMTQNEDGSRVPYMPTLRWTDGSLVSDLPALRMRRLHNVNHFIVSQTNPHVIPFVNAHEPPNAFSTVRDFALSSVRVQARSVLDLVGDALPVAGLKGGVKTVSSILGQSYHGNITILPEISLWRYINVTANPSMESITRFIMEGERATWPRMPMIQVQTRISRALERALARFEVAHPGDAGTGAEPKAA